MPTTITPAQEARQLAVARIYLRARQDCLEAAASYLRALNTHTDDLTREFCLERAQANAWMAEEYAQKAQV